MHVVWGSDIMGTVWSSRQFLLTQKWLHMGEPKARGPQKK